MKHAVTLVLLSAVATATHLCGCRQGILFDVAPADSGPPDPFEAPADVGSTIAIGVDWILLKSYPSVVNSFDLYARGPDDVRVVTVEPLGQFIEETGVRGGKFFSRVAFEHANLSVPHAYYLPDGSLLVTGVTHEPDLTWHYWVDRAHTPHQLVECDEGIPWPRAVTLPDGTLFIAIPLRCSNEQCRTGGTALFWLKEGSPPRLHCDSSFLEGHGGAAPEYWEITPDGTRAMGFEVMSYKEMRLDGGSVVERIDQRLPWNGTGLTTHPTSDGGHGLLMVRHVSNETRMEIMSRGNRLPDGGYGYSFEPVPALTREHWVDREHVRHRGYWVWNEADTIVIYDPRQRELIAEWDLPGPLPGEGFRYYELASDGDQLYLGARVENRKPDAPFREGTSEFYVRHLIEIDEIISASGR